MLHFSKPWNWFSVCVSGKALIGVKSVAEFPVSLNRACVTERHSSCKKLESRIFGLAAEKVL